VTPKEFRELLEPHARKVEAETGIPWQVMCAQVALETGWLKYVSTDRNTGQPSYNLFNIKGYGPAGAVEINTTEYINGKRTKVVDKFRAYNNYEESFKDYANLLKNNKRYGPVFYAKTPEEFAMRLQECGYATDPDYASKLISIMRKYFKEE
jgi:flagellar protein FlgJ